MNGPNYDSYSEQQLRQAYKSIDAERFPERRIEIAARLAALAALPPAPAVPPEDPALAAPRLAIMRRAGAVLVVCSLVTTAIAAWNFWYGNSGMFSVELALLILGIAIMRGHLRSAAWMRWVAAMTLPGWLLYGGMEMLFTPFDLSLTALRLYPLAFLINLLLPLLVLSMDYWLMRQLSRAPLLAAQIGAGRRPARLRIPFALGAAATLASSTALFFMLHGDAAQRAESIARTQLGTAYRYHVNAINVMHGNGKTRVIASVQAWNRDGIVNLPVQWQE